MATARVAEMTAVERRVAAAADYEEHLEPASPPTSYDAEGLDAVFGLVEEYFLSPFSDGWRVSVTHGPVRTEIRDPPPLYLFRSTVVLPDVPVSFATRRAMTALSRAPAWNEFVLEETMLSELRRGAGDADGLGRVEILYQHANYFAERAGLR
eukprot:tig00000157_g9657.t1